MPSSSRTVPTPSQMRAQPISRPLAQRKEPQISETDIMELSSDEEPTQQATSTSKAPSKPKRQAKQQEISASGRQQDRPSAATSSKQRQSLTKSPVRASKPATTPQQSSSRTQEQSVRKRTPRPGMTQLLSRKPTKRCKITNPALQPSSMSNTSKEHSQAQQPVSLSRPRPSAVKAPSFFSSPEESANVEVGLQTAEQMTSVDEPIQLSSSPMFIPEDMEVEGGAVPEPNQSRASTPDSFLADMVHTADAISPTRADNAQNEVRYPEPEIVEEEQPLEDVPIPAQPNNELTLDNQPILPPPDSALGALPMQLSPSRQRPFRRVRSENDAEDNIDEALRHFDGFSAPPPSFLAPSGPSPLRPRAVSRSPTKLRRAASDSITMEPENETVTSYNIQPLQQSEQDTGPWTTTEAYLLFESWPAGKVKPDYGVAAPSELRAGQTRVMRAIISARDMLQDEIDVL
jgi:hypothetical protein